MCILVSRYTCNIVKYKYTIRGSISEERMGGKKLFKVVSTKVTAEDYDLCRKIARQFYINERIQAPSVSELIRLVLYRELNRYRSHGHASSDARHPRQLYLSPLMNKTIRPPKR